MLATKCVIQTFQSDSIDALLRDCLTLTYNAIHYAEENDIANRKGMKEFYRSLKGVELPSCYKVGVITRACAVVESRRKSERRGVKIQHPKSLKPAICIISGFFITAKGRLFIPLQRRNEYADVLLNRYVQKTLEGKKIRSLTVTPDRLVFCYSQEVEPIPVRTVYGVDRNEKNLTFGDSEGIVQVDLSKTVRVRQNTRDILGSFRRDDVRIRKRLASKYWRRAKNRTNQILHATTNFLVDKAAKEGAAIALEDITGIRSMYRRGNGQGSEYRFRLNSWPHFRAYHMLEYKTAWKGVTTIQLTKAETYGSSTVHWRCGERLHEPARGDAMHRRMLWCQFCKVWVDRDVNSAIALSERGRSRFDRSLPPWPTEKSRQQQVILLLAAGEKGLAGEAMEGNGTKTPILRVDASKLGGRRGPTLNSEGYGPST